MKRFFKSKKTTVSLEELIRYPKGSLGFHLGHFLSDNSYRQDPVPEIEDVFRLLLANEASNKEEIGMHFYLCGNGDLGLGRLAIAIVGVVSCPHYSAYFYKRYKEGKNALRFYDLDHFRMLHLPLQRIKETFLIR